MAKREVFLGREALAEGRLTRSELVRWYQPLFRGVYMPKGNVTLWDRAKAAWLATGRQAVVTGVAAAGLYGANWVDAHTPIELITPRHGASNSCRTINPDCGRAVSDRGKPRLGGRSRHQGGPR